MKKYVGENRKKEEKETQASVGEGWRGRKAFQRHFIGSI